MVRTINDSNFGGPPGGHLLFCHRGLQRPRVTPSLVALYGARQTSHDIITAAGGASEADRIFDKYLNAVGGAARVRRSRASPQRAPIKAGTTSSRTRCRCMRASRISDCGHGACSFGERSMVYDGRMVGLPRRHPSAPVPVEFPVGSGAGWYGIEAELTFPARIKQGVRGRAGRRSGVDQRSRCAGRAGEKRRRER
jgi:hypothetical protein